jgi:WD40 repeat protein
MNGKKTLGTVVMRKFLFYVFISLVVLSCNAKQAQETAINTIPTELPTKFNTPIPTSTISPTKNVLVQTPTSAFQKREIYNISVSPDGKMLAISASYGVQVYNLVNGKLVFSFEKESLISFQGIYSYIAWSPNGKFLAVGKPNIGVRLWNTSTWKLLTEKGSDTISSPFELPGFAWSPDDSQLALGMQNGEIQIWNSKEQSWTTKLTCDIPQISLTWGADGQLWIFSHYGIYNAGNCTKIKSSDLSIDTGYEYAVWSPDKRNVYIFYDLGGGITDIYKTNPTFGSCCYSEIAWSMNGRYFAATPEKSNEITIWDTLENKVILQEKQGEVIYAFSWLPNDELLTFGRMNGKNVLWNTNTDKILITLEK